MLKDLRTGSGSSLASSLTVLGSRFFFIASGDSLLQELWQSDGTAAGTMPIELKDVATGATGRPVSIFSQQGKSILVRATTGVLGSQIWKTDGTPAGTALVEQSYADFASQLTPDTVTLDQTTYFTANDGLTGTGPMTNELWKTDGTAAGTALVKDINASPKSGRPRLMTQVGNKVFLVANEQAHEQFPELWVTDQMTGLTSLVQGSPGVLKILKMAAYGNQLVLLRANAQANVELCLSDGTTSGPTVVQTAGTYFGSDRSVLRVSAETIFFIAPDQRGGDDLWVSRGTPESTKLLKSLGLAGLDLTPELVVLNGVAYFNTLADESIRLWKSDGTLSGTGLVAPFFESYLRFPHQLRVAGHSLYLFATSPTYELALWKTDGTTEGTYLVKQLSDVGVYEAVEAVVFGRTLFFTTYASEAVPAQLWKSDGTAEGTVIVRSFAVGRRLSDLSQLTAGRQAGLLCGG